MWYDEIKQYRFPDGGFSMQTGHFTQVVWRGTTQVGCGHSQCNGNDIWVCEYDPPGNWEGQYRENVLPTAAADRLASPGSVSTCTDGLAGHAARVLPRSVRRFDRLRQRHRHRQRR